MTDCPNVEMREQLPEFVHGMLDAPARERVQAHVDGCTECAQELAILRSVIEAAVIPQIDVTRIAAAIPAYRQREVEGMESGIDNTVISLPVRRPWFQRASVQLAAGLMVAAIGLSTVVMNYERPSSGTTSVQGTIAAGNVGNQGLTLVAVNSLDNGQIEQLIAGMDSLDALPSIEPEPANMALLDGGI
jgi:anti-sigma factor RsiW